nr:hypothetical protein [uncultured Noviherbaspirillum sp.]
MNFPLSEKNSTEGSQYDKISGVEIKPEQEVQLNLRVNTPAIQRSDEPNTEKYSQTQFKSRPYLSPPEFSAIGLIALLKELQRTNSSSDLSFAFTNAKQISAELDVRRANDVENKATLRAQQATEDKKIAEKKITNWIVGIAGLVAAFVGIGLAIFFSGGVAAVPGIVAAGLVIGAFMATLNVTNLIVQEAGAKRQNVFGESVAVDLSISGLVEADFEKEVAVGRIKIVGVNASSETPGAISREQYEKDKGTAILVVNVIVGCAMLILAVASLGSAFNAGRAAVQAGTVVGEQAGQTAQATTQIAQNASRAQLAASAVAAGASAVGAAGSGFNAYLSFGLGIIKNDKATTLINEKVIEAAIQALQQRFDQSQQSFQNAMNFQETLRTRIAEAMEKYFGITSNIIRNITV